MSHRKGRIAVVIVAVGAAVVAVAGGANAAGNPSITDNSVDSSDLKNGGINQVDLSVPLYNLLRTPAQNTVTSWSVTDGSLGLADFSAAAKEGLKGDKGDAGARGEKGDQGDKGDKGDPGQDAVYTGAHWGTIHRNVIGAADAELGATSTAAPMGVGALNLHTASADDKVAFGNEVDFNGTILYEISAIGYNVYTTGENNALGNNMPSIILEIDPNMSTKPGVEYASLVYTPSNSAANAWTAINARGDATAHWGLTGTAFNGTPCSINGARCTWSEVLQYLDDGGDPAVVGYSVGISKGRDYAFSGAVDAFQFNGKTYDFEPTGVQS